MKNILDFKANESSNFIKSLWKTDFFRSEHDKNGFIGLLIKEVVKQPISFYEFSDEKLEKRHMTPWFNHIAIRDTYDEGFEYVQDLYIFHELFHLATMPNVKFDNFEDWMNSMWKNELYASLSTEVFIYHWYPELRSKTFKFEIWYDILLDRFGTLPKNQKINLNTVLCHEMPELFIKVLNLRLEFRNGRKPENASEEWFVRYNNFEKWFENWRPNFESVQNARIEIIQSNSFEKFNEKYIGKDKIAFKESIAIY